MSGLGGGSVSFQFQLAQLFDTVDELQLKCLQEIWVLVLRNSGGHG